MRVEVFATHHDMEVLEFMETMDLQVTRRKGSLQTRGPIGDIVIVSRPRGAHLTDVVVETSVRKKQLGLDLELSGVARGLDPTRAIFAHHGGDVGDVHTVNMYLNMIPLQEREEWLSAWAASGEMPFMAVEFGPPLSNTFLRGRNGFGKRILTEPFVTEYAAMYLGRDAYAAETEAYRKAMQTRF